ncbi:NarK family nitrate/nitrite MFS transporter [Pseudalkalibacillus hwajinpoensis]|uniref:NarK family nitrate/nitrite MFS transporter n=1 Tax=Guptibacillus hwajinpoensis TaxID=208199 RepID=UPI00325B6EA0
MIKRRITPNVSILGLTTFAFFLSFVVWFNMAPFIHVIQEKFQLTSDEIGALLIMNVALTIPARVLIGVLVDRFGPRKVYSSLLVVMSVPCIAFALATTYWQLLISRMFLGIIGAGFVIGIRMISEWFPEKRMGIAEGIYGGWGNFGSAAAAMSLPVLALLLGGEEGWRYAIGITGLLVLIYGIVFYFTASDTPHSKSLPGEVKRKGGLEVTSYKDLIGLIAIMLPMYGILGVFLWKLYSMAILTSEAAIAGCLILLILFISSSFRAIQYNRPALEKGVPEEEQYSFKQVFILASAYFVTFGSELAVVSMLPLFFSETFDLGLAEAGIIAGSFAFTNLVARPLGGYLSDRFGRKLILTIMLFGLSIGYFLLSQVSGTWPLALAIAVTMLCSFFVQGGEGAVFAMVPLIKKKVTGQIAGLVGAYGNVGATTFLTVYSMVQPGQFFLVISVTGAVCTAGMILLVEPKQRAVREGKVSRVPSNTNVSR